MTNWRKINKADRDADDRFWAKYQAMKQRADEQKARITEAERQHKIAEQRKLFSFRRRKDDEQ